MLDDDDKRELLSIARKAVEDRLVRRAESSGQPLRERLLAPAGAFVTIHRDGQLRGCIGTVEPVRPLYQVVREMAVAAATRDRRFVPIAPDEIEAIDFEISVLGSWGPVSGPGDITIGTHGLSIEHRGRRGILLPQVATERDWDADTFLVMVCRKAGLGDDAWRQPGAVVERFTATVFSER